MCHHLMDVDLERMTARALVLAAQLCYLGEMWSCRSEDDMKTTLGMD
jgi:hypothetical protein